MNKEYTQYTAKALLEDDFFIQSTIYPTTETGEYWHSLLTDGILEYREYEEARSFILQMRRPKKVMTAKERNDMWIQIEVMNKQNLRKSIRKKQMYLWGVAAAMLLVLAVFSFLFFGKTEPVQLNFEAAMAGIPGDAAESKDIQLVLADQVIDLKETSVDIQLNKEGEVLVNSKQMAETTLPVKEEEIHYNQLIVPNGRHSHLILADGTKMHINSGSKVIFPHKFKKNEREIFVDGEVFLDVAQDNATPFYIRTATVDVKVMGTSLNVRAYKEDREHEVVLLSGSVLVQTKDKHEAVLLPNQKLGYADGKCYITSTNAQEYVSWINGYFIYKRVPLNHIMKQISRYYGIEVVCGQHIEMLTCSGKLDLKEDMDRVMNDLAQILSLTIDIKDNTYHIY